MPTLPQSEWPDACRRPEVAGIFVGGCVARGEGSRFRHKAHAHTSGPHKGWLCVLAARRLQQEELMLHEVAHLIAGCGHTDKWRRVLLEIGGTLGPVIDPTSRGGLLLRSYRKRTKGKA